MRRGMPARNKLYNLADDPSETRNVAGDHEEKMLQLQKLLDDQTNLDDDALQKPANTRKSK